MANEDNGNDTPLANLLGCSSKLDLYNKLLEKSVLVFPEYNTRARQGISKYIVNLISSDTVSNSNGKLVDLYGKNGRLFYHLKKLAEKGFASYASGKRKGKIKLDIEKIKTWWLDAKQPITEKEFKTAAITRIDRSARNISNKVHGARGNSGLLTVLSDIASNLETLETDVGSYETDKDKKVFKVITKTNEGNASLIELLGCTSKSDLYSKLLEKSVFVFPEYEIRARKGVCKHLSELLELGVGTGGEFVELGYKFNKRNIRFVKHLEKLAEKGFAVYAKAQHRGKFRLNTEQIKNGWLIIDHQKTNEELANIAIRRIDGSIKNILHATHVLVGMRGTLFVLSNVASNLEMLETELNSYFLNKDGVN